MAGARTRLHKAAEPAMPRRSARGANKTQPEDEVPAVFRDMLRDEETFKGSSVDEGGPPPKKRKTGPTRKSPSPAGPASPAFPHTQSHFAATVESAEGDRQHTNGRVRQTIVDSDESEDSDLEWEDALADSSDTDEGEDAAPQIGNISIAIGAKKTDDTGARRKVRRRAITSVDKKRRLDIHKMHVLCLLYHVCRRNAWCNDRRAQSTLRKMVPPKVLSNLVPNPDLTQYSASKQFIDGMNELKVLWSKRFKITAQGMYKPRWAEVDAAIRPFSDFDDLDSPMDKDDFRTAAHTLQGSQDVGTQLFCALLRGIGIETRLVCSLQPLPFSSAAERATPQKTSVHQNTIVVDPYNKPAEASPTKSRTQSPRSKKLSRLERVMGERHAVLNHTGVAPKKQKAYHTPYPVYWVEVLNPAYQKWISIDTHSTFTVNSPEKLEPPLSFADNILAYAIAFEDDHTAKDVTRRYAKAYNAKTLKYRVESTPGGAQWWRRTMKFFRRASPLDRDQMEDATLARKEASEGIPKNVQDFKGHPIYVLERHLKHNEVIHPLNQVGKVNCGTAMNPKMEPIYRRTNVYVVRTADKWYRMGRDVKFGEQPLKRAKPKKGRRISMGADVDVEEEEADEVGAGLFAEFQTEIYVPPPVVRGRVPRNIYGNLDLYVPSMCPAGGTHIRHKLASKAARIVGVDFADAVTGFSFKGRHGTAVVQGIVVAQEYADAVQSVIDGMLYQQEEAETAARRAESLRLWRRFFLGLRIAQRVNAIEIDGEKGPVLNVQDEITREDRELAAREMAGGFFPDEGDVAEPSGRVYQPPHRDHDGGGFIADSNGASNDDGGGGGFIPEDEDTAPIALNRHQSFESSILDSQQLRPPRRSSFGQVYSSEDDDEGGGWVHGDLVDGVGPAIAAEDAKAISAQVDGIADDEAQSSKPDASSSTDAQQQQRKPETDKDAPPPAQATVASQGVEDISMKSPPAQLPSSSPSDNGSLLLEDPEDEDADPDWLVDAT